MLYTRFRAWISRVFTSIGKNTGSQRFTFKNSYYKWESRSCLRSCTKPTQFLPNNEGPRRLHNPVDRNNMSDEFWSRNADDIQTSQSSLTTSNQGLVTCDLDSKTTKHQSEFINHGLTLWSQNRVRWTQTTMRTNQSHKSRKRRISLYASYDSLLGTKQAFRKPIPLAEMVEFLVDVWDEEGLYD